jgi:hypothetical protein
MALSWYGQTGQPGISAFQSFQDSKLNTWNLVGSEVQGVNGLATRVYKCDNLIGGSGHTFTVGLDVSNTVFFWYIEVPTDNGNGIIVDQSAHGPADATSPYDSQTLTPTAGEDAMMVGYIQDDSNGGTNQVWTDNGPQGFTQLDTTFNTPATDWTGMNFWQHVASTSGSYHSSWTESGTGFLAPWTTIGTLIIMTQAPATQPQGWALLRRIPRKIRKLQRHPVFMFTESLQAAQFQASVTMSLIASGNLTTQIQMSSGVTMSLLASGSLTTQIQMASGVTMSLVASGDLTTSIRMASSVTMSLIAAGDLTTQIQMAASVTMTLNASGALTTAITMASSVTMTLNATGDLTAGNGMAASVTMSLIAAGTLTTQIQMAGAVSMTLNTSGSLTTAIQMAGAVSMTLNASGSLTTQINLAAAVTMSMTNSGALTTAIGLAAGVTMTLNASGSLLTAIRMAAAVSMTLNAAGDLTTGVLIGIQYHVRLTVSKTVAIKLAAVPVVAARLQASKQINKALTCA